jgi:pimeloyl-ACP methyl ester carboxylesterase
MTALRIAPFLLSLIGILATPARAAGPAGQAAPELVMVPCEIRGISPPTDCGELPVPEDRDAPGSHATIGLAVVRLGATGQASGEDPLFVLLGGPGSSATAAAPWLANTFSTTRRERDIVLVDQRGTGRSNPLECDLYGDPANLDSHTGDFIPLAAARACLSLLGEQHDLAQYITSRFADDLDDVRRALGYRRVRLFAVSYGTRVALDYMRRHPEHASAVVLQGVSPPHRLDEYRLAEHAERALQGVLEECLADTGCAAAFPALRQQTQALFEQLRNVPAPVTIVNPVSGELATIRMSHDLAAEAVRYLLYSPQRTALLPRILHDAAEGSLEALAEFAVFSRINLVNSGANGLYISITCAEDLGATSSAVADARARGTFWSGYRYPELFAVCAEWPRARVPSDFSQPVVSETPVLVLSGQWDPATPPSDGDAAALHLSNATHLVVPHGGHSFEGLVGAECVQRVIAGFLQTATTEGLDTGCVARIHRAGFRTDALPMRWASVPSAAISRVAGDYRIEGTPMTVVLQAAADRLHLHAPDGSRLLLVPVSTTRFRVVGLLGSYLTVELEDERVRGLRFEQPGTPPLRLVSGSEPG